MDRVWADGYKVTMGETCEQTGWPIDILVQTQKGKT
jgi:hypothetical protein